MCDQYYDYYKRNHEALDNEDFDFLKEDLLEKIENVITEGDYFMDEYKSKIETIEKLCGLLEDNKIDYSEIDS